jgi:hypothetical protein
MCTEDRLSVTPEKIVVQDKDNRGHFLQQWAAGAFHRYALHYYSYAELLHNKKIHGKEKQERNHFNEYCKQCAFYRKISHAMTNWSHEIDKRGYNECFTSIT